MSGMEDFARRQPTPPCPYVTGSVTRYCTLTPFTLTDEEREAIKESIQFAFPASHPTATTLRNLLQRTK
jgi:hypothetical protein